MYTVINFKTKKALKESFASGKQIEVFQHKWYAQGYAENGVLTKLN